MLKENKFLLSVVVVLLAVLPAGAADPSKGNDILAHHLDAIGSPALRSGLKTRVVEGAALYKIISGGTGSIQGKAVFASQQRMLHYLLKVVADRYHGEQILFDGDHVDVAATFR